MRARERERERERLQQSGERGKRQVVIDTRQLHARHQNTRCNSTSSGKIADDERTCGEKGKERKRKKKEKEKKNRYIFVRKYILRARTGGENAIRSDRLLSESCKVASTRA